MSRGIAYGLGASVLMWAAVGAAIAACLRLLPTSDPAFYPSGDPHHPGVNWLGQGGGAVLAYTLALLAAVYAAKYLINHFPAGWVRVYAFASVVAASLPYLWLLVVTDWHNLHIYRVACWVYVPVGFWVIPTASFVIDTIAPRVPRARWYIARSALEVVLMAPWCVAWAVISFFVLRGGSIDVPPPVHVARPIGGRVVLVQHQRPGDGLERGHRPGGVSDEVPAVPAPVG